MDYRCCQSAFYADTSWGSDLLSSAKNSGVGPGGGRSIHPPEQVSTAEINKPCLNRSYGLICLRSTASPYSDNFKRSVYAFRHFLQRTGSPAFHALWSYVQKQTKNELDIDKFPCSFLIQTVGLMAAKLLVNQSTVSLEDSRYGAFNERQVQRIYSLPPQPSYPPMSERPQMAGIISVSTALLARVRRSDQLKEATTQEYSHALVLLTRAVSNEK